MSTNDPVADLCTRIRNGQAAGNSSVSVNGSKLKLAILQVLKDEGYIEDFLTANNNGKLVIDVRLKYFNGMPVIGKIRRESKPGRRVYKGVSELPSVLGGLGTAIVSTSLGVMTDKGAREAGQGGEILCLVE